MSPPKTPAWKRNFKRHLVRNNCLRVTKARYPPRRRPSPPHPPSSSPAQTTTAPPSQPSIVIEEDHNPLQRPPGASPVVVIVTNDDGPNLLQHPPQADPSGSTAADQHPAQSTEKYAPPNLRSLTSSKIHHNFHRASPEWSTTDHVEQPEEPPICEVCLEELPTVRLDCSENRSPEPHSLCPRCVLLWWHSQLSNAAPNQPLPSTISCPKCRSIVHRVWADNILGEYSEKPGSDGSWDVRLDFTKYVGLIPWMARRSLQFGIDVSLAYR